MDFRGRTVYLKDSLKLVLLCFLPFSLPQQQELTANKENPTLVMQFSIEIKNAGDAVTAVIALEQTEGIFEGRIKGQTLLVKSKLSYQDVIQKLQQSGIVAAFVQCTQSDGTLRSY